jgi:hypothetical protein
MTPAEYEYELIFIGIVALRVEGGHVEIDGFAPAPSQNAIVSPAEL